MKYTHTNIISTDWEKLAEFYTEVFDCQLVPPIRNQSGAWLERGTGVNGAALKGAHLRLPGYGEEGPTLEIYQYRKVDGQEALSPNERGFGHIAFEVEDVGALLEKVERFGGKRYGEITKRQVEGVGTITFIYVRDPEGNFIELQHWVKPS